MIRTSDSDRPRKGGSESPGASSRDAHEGSPSGSRSSPLNSGRGGRHSTPLDRSARFEDGGAPSAPPSGEESTPSSTPTEATLDFAIRDAGAQPTTYWGGRYGGDLSRLVVEYAQLVRRIAAAAEGGKAIVVDRPDRVTVRPDGALAPATPEVFGVDVAGAADPYRAPEYYLSGPSRSPTDAESVYSLAAILHHVLTGAPPFPGRDPTQVVHRILSGDPIPSHRWGDEIPSGVRQYVHDALSFDPQRRPPTLTAFAIGLEAAAGGDLPRGTPAHLRETPPAQPMRVALTIGTMVVVLLAVVWLVQSAFDTPRSPLLVGLEGVAFSRPFPAHGEDPPTHPIATTRLDDLRRDLAGRELDPEVQLMLGWAELRTGARGAALRAFRRAADHSRDFAPARISAGIARVEGGDSVGVIEIEQGLRIPAESARDWLFRGAGHLYLLQYPAAASAFDRAAELDPDSFDAWFHAAWAHWLAGNAEPSRRAVARAESIRPESPWVDWLFLELESQRGAVSNEKLRRQVLEERARWVGEPALLLRGGSLLTRLGFGAEGEQWLERAAEQISHAGDATRVTWSNRGRIVYPGRTSLFYGPPPLPRAEPGDALPRAVDEIRDSRE